MEDPESEWNDHFSLVKMDIGKSIFKKKGLVYKKIDLFLPVEIIIT